MSSRSHPEPPHSLCRASSNYTATKIQLHILHPTHYLSFRLSAYYHISNRLLILARTPHNSSPPRPIVPIFHYSRSLTMPFCRPASRALSHMLRHEPVHYSSPASLFARHSPLAPFSRAFNDPFFSSPFSAPLYTVYELREDDSNNTSSDKAEHTEQQTNKHEEMQAAEQQKEQQQQRSNDSRLTRHSDHHNKRWLDRHSNRRHHDHNHNHHPLSVFSPFESLFNSPLFASSPQPLEMTVDLYSTPTAYQVNAAIPGVSKEDIKVTVDDGVLTIEAERREERGRPAKSTPAPAASATATATAAPADAKTEAPHSEQKAVEVEVKADNVDNKPATATEATAANTQPQQSAEQQQDDEEVSVHHQESYYGRVKRSLSLPDDVNVDGLTAKYENGVLKIELPRQEEKRQQVKQINIQ